MKQKFKKVVSLILVFTISFAISVPSLAAQSSTSNSSSISNYQALIDKINKEYGVSLFIPTKTELKKAEISNTSRATSMSSESKEQFEDQLREIAKNLSKQNTEAQAAWEAATSNKSEDSPIVTSGKLVASVTNVSSQNKDIEGAEAYFEGYVNDSTGYWRWTKFTKTGVTPDYSSDTVKFMMDDKYGTYSYKFIDSHRTCSVIYKGTMYTNTILGWVAAKSSQYVEWYASEGL